MRTPSIVLPAAGLVLMLAGCSVSATSDLRTADPSPAETSPTQRIAVDWDAYPPGTQSIIDEEQSEGDCDALQEMFDVADKAGFLDQMKYIDEALRLAGCYD